MAYLYWVQRLLLVVLAYGIFKRLSALFISLLASGKKLRVSVDSIGFLIVRGVTLSFAQGPVASVSFRELSLGRSASAKKAASRVATAVTSFRPRIPLTLRGVRVQLRTPPPPLPQTRPNKQQQSAAADPSQPLLRPSRQAGPSASEGLVSADHSPTAMTPPLTRQGVSAEEGASAGSDSAGARRTAQLQRALAFATEVAEGATVAWEWLSERLPVHLPLRLAADAALQLLLTLLPSVPVRVKDIEVSFKELRLLLAVERVVVLLHSSNKLTQLEASLTVGPIVSSVAEGSGDERAPVLDVKQFSASAGLTVYWRAGGLRLASFAGELGDTAVTLTPALLAAVLAFERLPRDVVLLEEGAAPLPRAKRPARPLLERLPHLLARAPQEAEFKAPLLELRSAGFQSPAGGDAPLEVALCARQLRVGIDTRAPLPRRRSVTNTLRASSGFGGDTQLLQVSGTFGGFEARAGVAGQSDALAARGGSSQLSCRLVQAPQGWARRQPVRLTANGTLDVGPVTGTVRMHTVWNSVATGVAWWQHDGVHMPRRIMQPPAKVLAAVTPAVLPHDSARPSSAGGPVPEGEQPPGTPLIQGRFGMLRRGSLRSGSWTGSLAADGLAAPGAPPPSLQLHFETNVLASSRLQLLDEQDEAVVVVCGSGVSVSLTSQVADSPGSISENSPVLARSNVFATPVKGQRRASGVASAAATPQAMRQAKEMPATPMSATSGWLRSSSSLLRRGSSSGFDLGAAAQYAQGLQQQKRPPFLATISLRADLGGLQIDVAGGDSSSSGSTPARPTPPHNADGGTCNSAESLISGVPSAFADASEQQEGAVSDVGLGNVEETAAVVNTGMRRLVTISSTVVTMLPQVSDDSREIEFEGKAVVSGIASNLDLALVRSLVELVAAWMPPQQTLAALKAINPPTGSGTSGPSKPLKPADPAPSRQEQLADRKKPPVQLLSLGFALEDWCITYSCSTSIKGSSALPGSQQLARDGIPFQEVLTIGSVGAEVQIEERSITAVLSDLAVSYVESEAPAASNATTPAGISSAGSTTSAAAGVDVAPARDPTMSLSDSPTDKVATAVVTPTAVRMLHLPTITVGILPPPAELFHSLGFAHVPARSVSSVHVDVGGIGVKFEPDVAFAAVDVAAELTEVAAHFSKRAARRAEDAAADVAYNLADAAEHPGHATQNAASAAVDGLVRMEAEVSTGNVPEAAQQLHRGGAAEHPIAVQLRKLQVPQKVDLAVQVRDISADVSLAEGVQFSVQVGSIRHKLGTLAGEVAAVSVSLNGSPVAKLFELRAQLEVLAPGPLDTSTPSRVTAASAASGAFGASGGLAGTPPLSGVGLLGDLELPEDSDSVQLGFDGETPTGTPEAAGFRSKGVPEQGRSGQAGMPFSGDPVELHKARQRAGIPADKTPAVMVPVLAVSAVVSGVRILLPHGVEVGTHIRHTELWGQAFSQELEEHVKRRMQPKKSRRGRSKGSKATNPAVELRVRVEDAAFVMLHHPLEAWLSTHGRPLRAAVAEQRLWERALDALPVPTAEELGSDWDATICQVTTDYRTSCCQVARRDGNLMRVGVDEVTALVVLCAGGAAGEQAARDHIEAVDPPSVGVPLDDPLLRLQLAIGLKGAAVHFCLNTQPLAGADDVNVCGTVAIARQVTAPPATEARAFPVGRRRTVTTQVTIKGSKAQPKLYTDMHVDVIGVTGGFGMGLQPSIGLVSMAGKRLSPSDPDKSRPKPRKLQWWDDLRYLWRGKVRVTAHDIDFALASTIDPQMSDTVRRMQVKVQRMDVKMVAGSITIAMDELGATMHAAAHPAHAPSALLALPCLQLPSVLTRAAFTWHLASGRDPSDHYLYPVPVPDGEGVRQEPVELAQEVEAATFDVKMDILLGASQIGSDGFGPTIYAGDHQMRFMEEMMATMKSPPMFIKLPKKRGTFFARKAGPSGDPDVENLLRGFDISLQASPLEIVHWTLDTEDPSHGVALGIEDVTYEHRLLLNQPVSEAEKRLLPKTHDGTKSDTLAVDVKGSNLTITLDNGQDGRHGRSLLAAHATGSGRSTTSTSTGPAASSKALFRTISEPACSDAITSIASFSVHQGPSDPTYESTAADRTVQVAMQDCRFAFDLASRDAIWGAAEHMAAGVVPFKKPPFKGSTTYIKGEDLSDGEQPADGPAGQGESSAVNAAAQDARESGHGSAQDAVNGYKDQLPQQMSQQLSQALSRRGSMMGDRMDRATSRNAAQADYETGGELMRIISQQDRAEAAASRSPGGVQRAAEQALAVAGQDVPDDASDVVLHAASDDDVEGISSPEEHLDQSEEASQPTVRFRIQVTSLQVAAVDSSGARFLLAAETAHVMGVDMPNKQRVTTLAVREVQAYMSKPVQGATPWLDHSHGELIPSSDHIRMVFTPFSLQLRHAKTKGTSGQDLRIQAPEISATLSSREFLGFVDVVRHVMMPPPPKVTKLNGELSLLGEPEDDAVAAGREAFALLYQEVASLSAEAHMLRSGLATSWHSATSGASRRRLGVGTNSIGRNCSNSSRIQPVQVQVLQAAEEGDDMGASLQEAMQDHIASLVPGAVDDRTGPAGRRLLLRWVREQGDGATQALAAVQDTVTEAKAAARKRMLANDSAKIAVDIDAIKWSLVHERIPFFSASLSGLKLAMTRNEDNSGFSKFIIQRIEIEEPRSGGGTSRRSSSGCPGQGGADRERRAIVSAWNPDESWDDDPAVRATAVLGVPTEDRMIYDNLDLLVHPMTVSFTDSQLTQLWDYFFPKPEEDPAAAAAAAAKKPTESLLKSMLTRTLKGGKNEPAKPSADQEAGAAEGQQELNEEALEALPEDNMAAIAGFLPPGMAQPDPAARPASLPDEPSHHGSQSSTARPKWLSLKTPWGRSNPEPAESEVSSASMGSTVLAHPSVANALANASGTSAQRSGKSSDSKLSDGKGRKAAGPARIALFRHVRFNRVLVAITYKGTYLSLNDAKMVLDNRQYTGVEGSWSDLFQSFKWDIVKSVLKSMTGMQGSKVKEVLPGQLRAVGSRTERRAMKKTMKAWLTGRTPLPASSDPSSPDPPDEATLQELRKTQLLLGHRHVQRLTERKQAAAAAAAAAAEAAALSSRSIQPVRVEPSMELPPDFGSNGALSRDSLSATEASAAAAAATERATLCQSSAARAGAQSGAEPAPQQHPSATSQLPPLDMQTGAAGPSSPEGRPHADLVSGSPFNPVPPSQSFRDQPNDQPSDEPAVLKQASRQPLLMPHVRGA